MLSFRLLFHSTGPFPPEESYLVLIGQNRAGRDRKNEISDPAQHDLAAAQTLMSKMTTTGKDHREALLVTGLDDFLIPL